MMSAAFSGTKLNANRPAQVLCSKRRVARAQRASLVVEARRVTVLGAGTADVDITRFCTDTEFKSCFTIHKIWQPSYC